MNPKFKELLLAKAKKGAFLAPEKQKMHEDMMNAFDEGYVNKLGGKLKAKVTVAAKDPADLKKGLEEAKKIVDLKANGNLPEEDLAKDVVESEDGEGCCGEEECADGSCSGEMVAGENELADPEAETEASNLPADPMEMEDENANMSKEEVMAKLLKMTQEIEMLKAKLAK